MTDLKLKKSDLVDFCHEHNLSIKKSYTISAIMDVISEANLLDELNQLSSRDDSDVLSIRVEVSPGMDIDCVMEKLGQAFDVQHCSRAYKNRGNNKSRYYITAKMTKEGVEQYSKSDIDELIEKSKQLDQLLEKRSRAGRRPLFDENDVATMERMKAQGSTYSDIADQFYTSKKTVIQYLKHKKTR